MTHQARKKSASCRAPGLQAWLVVALTVLLPLVAHTGKPTRHGPARPGGVLDQTNKQRQAPVAPLARRADSIDEDSTASDGQESPGSTDIAPVQSYTLDNGMRVFFIADQRTPSVVVQVWYQVGSADEPIGRTGISHLLEHMMFWNVEKKPEKRYRNRIESMGGKHNAFTSYDFTAYYVNVANVWLEEVIALEAQRMRKLKFDPVQLEKERQVVLEERHLRVNNQPDGDLREQLLITTFERGGQRNPIIGWNADIESISEAELYDWHRRWYRPDNAALIVVGDTDPEGVLALAEKYFGRISNNKDDESDSRRSRPFEPGQKTQKRVVLNAPGRPSQLKMLWKVPSLDRESFGQADIKRVVALDALSAFLGQGDSSWLHRKLVTEAGLASSVGAWAHTRLRANGMMWVVARPRQGVGLEKLEKAIVAELNSLKAEHIRPVDLQRVQSELIADATYLRDSPFYQAYTLGQLEFSGAGWEMFNDYEQMVRQVSIADMADSLSAYMRENFYSAGYILSGGADKTGVEP